VETVPVVQAQVEQAVVVVATDFMVVVVEVA
jgi:hypothetical protein